MGRNFYYVKEVAALLGVTTQAVTKEIHKNHLEAGRLGVGRWRVGVGTLKSYAKQHNLELNYAALSAPEQASPKPYIPPGPDNMM